MKKKRFRDLEKETKRAIDKRLLNKESPAEIANELGILTQDLHNRKGTLIKLILKSKPATVPSVKKSNYQVQQIPASNSE